MNRSIDHKRPHWGWVLVAAPLLFLLHVSIFGFRIERIQNIVTGVIFLPAGLMAAFALIYWLRASHSAEQKRNIWIGYLMGMPFAFVGSLIVPVYLSPWLGTTLGGALPWVFMTWIGYRLPTNAYQ